MSLLLTQKSSWEKYSDPLPIYNQIFCLFCVLLLSHELFIYFDVRFAGVFSWPAGRHFMSFGVSFAPQKFNSLTYRTGLYLFLLPPLWCRIRKTICKRREHGRRPPRPLPIVLASCAPGLPSARSSAHGGTCAARAAERGPASWRPHELRRPAGREPPAVLAGGSAGPVSACGSNTAPLMLRVGRGRLSVCLPGALRACGPWAGGGGSLLTSAAGGCPLWFGRPVCARGHHCHGPLDPLCRAHSALVSSRSAHRGGGSSGVTASGLTSKFLIHFEFIQISFLGEHTFKASSTRGLSLGV